MDIPLIISIEGVSIHREGVEILSDVSFDLAQGEMAYLVGASGSGKSSLIKAMYAERSVDTGDILVAGHDLRRISRKDIPALRRKIGMVFQEFNLFENWTVRKNLSYILRATDWNDKAKIQERVEYCVAPVGLSDKLDVIVRNLSGGEQQRVVIARAILNNPSLIIADEPTGNLDPKTSDQIFHLLYEVAAQNKSSMLIATHDFRIIEKFPARVFRCEHKQLYEVL